MFATGLARGTERQANITYMTCGVIFPPGGLHTPEGTSRRHGGLVRNGAATGPAKRGSLLDPYKPRINALLQEGVRNAVAIWRELQAVGHPGEVSMILDDIRPERPSRTGRATVRFETDPGERLRSDWGASSSLWRKSAQAA